MPRRVLDGGAEDHAINIGPQRRTHAHRARLARAIERETGQRDLLEPFCRAANRPDFGVATRIKFTGYVVQRAQQKLAGFCMDDARPEAARARRTQRACREGNQRTHPLGIAV